MLTFKDNEFLNLKMEGDSRIVIDLNIYNYGRIYRKANKIANYLTKKDI